MTTEALAFAAPDDLDAWLRDNHAVQTELWVRLYKKASGIPSIDWEQMVVVALCWGWIDGVTRALDDLSYMQRLTPRRPRSLWSQKNVGLVARLIAEGRMQPAGLLQVEAAKADGRWDAAYAGPADLVIPVDFLAACDATPGARATFEGLSRGHLYTIYYQLQTALRPETRAGRMARMIDRLAQGLPPK